MTKCTARVKGGCGRDVFARRLCEPHFRRLLRAEARHEIADLTSPVVERRRGGLVSVWGRVPAKVAAKLERLAKARGMTVYALAGQLLEAGAAPADDDEEGRG